MSDIRRSQPQPFARAIVGDRSSDAVSYSPTRPMAATWLVESLEDVAGRSLPG
jgi:hypothetical protein